MDQPKKTITVGMHYATMAALIISNLCLLGLAMLFSASYGQGIGYATWQIENKVSAASTPSALHGRLQGGFGSAIPNVPSFLRGTILADPAGVALTWDDNSNNELHFYIERSSGSTSTPTSTAPFVEIGSVGPNTDDAYGFYHDSGPFSEYTTYWYRVRAANAAGTSVYSNEASFSFTDLMPPSVPQNVRVTQTTCSGFAFTWNASVDNDGDAVLGYRIYESGAYSSNIYNGTTYTSNLGFYAFSTHTYSVAAFDAQFNVSQPSDPITVNRPLNCAPVAPRNPVISNTKGLTRVSWDDYSNNETTFYIERRDSPGASYAVIGKVGAGVTNFTDAKLNSNQQYCYVIRAWNQYGYSGYSQETCFMIMPPGSS